MDGTVSIPAIRRVLSMTCRTSSDLSERIEKITFAAGKPFFENLVAAEFADPEGAAVQVDVESALTECGKSSPSHVYLSSSGLLRHSSGLPVLGSKALSSLGGLSGMAQDPLSSPWVRPVTPDRFALVRLAS